MSFLILERWEQFLELIQGNPFPRSVPGGPWAGSAVASQKYLLLCGSQGLARPKLLILNLLKLWWEKFLFLQSPFAELLANYMMASFVFVVFSFSFLSSFLSFFPVGLALIQLNKTPSAPKASLTLLPFPGQQDEGPNPFGFSLVKQGTNCFVQIWSSFIHMKVFN